MTPQDRLRNLADYMATQLRVRGETFQEVTEAAGRRLPRRYRRDAADLIEIERAMAHPKRAYRVDERRFQRAERRLRWYLDRQDPNAARLGEFLDRLAVIAFIVVSVALAVFFYLLGNGYFD